MNKVLKFILIAISIALGLFVCFVISCYTFFDNMCGEDVSSIENKNYSLTFTTSSCGAFTPYTLDISFKKKKFLSNSHNIITAKRFEKATGYFLDSSIAVIDIDHYDFYQTYSFLIDIESSTLERFYMNGSSSSFDNFSRMDSVVLIESKRNEEFDINLFSILEYKHIKVMKIKDIVNKNENIFILNGFEIIKLDDEMLSFSIQTDSSSELLHLKVVHINELPTIVSFE